MSFDNNDPRSRLSSRRWRLMQSAWLVLPIVGLGLLSFAGYLYLALRLRTRKYWIVATVVCVATVVVMALVYNPDPDVHETRGTGWTGGLIVTFWLATIVYGLILNRDYLRRLAAKTPANAWYNQPGAVTPGSRASSLARGLVAPPEAPATTSNVPASPGDHPPFLGVDRHQYYAPGLDAPASTAGPSGPAPSSPTAPSTGVVDVNVASADEIAQATGLGFPLAERIVALRQHHGGFRDLDDLVAAAGLQPHEAVRFRNGVAFGSVRPRPPERPSGRILDY